MTIISKCYVTLRLCVVKFVIINLIAIIIVIIVIFHPGSNDPGS